MRMPTLLADFFHARGGKPFCEKSLTLPCGMIHCRKLASLRSKTSPYMRQKIMFLQTADFQQFAET